MEWHLWTKVSAIVGKPCVLMHFVRNSFFLDRPVLFEVPFEPQSDNNNHEKLTAAVLNTSGNHLVVIRFNSYVTFYMYMYFLLSV